MTPDLDALRELIMTPPLKLADVLALLSAVSERDALAVELDKVRAERDALTAERDALAEALNQGRADGWDEGHAAGWDDYAARSDVPDLTDTPNPYRTEEADHA